MPIFRFNPQRPLIEVTAQAADGVTIPLLMAFDTGADQTSISRRVALRLGFNPDASPNQVSVITASGSDTMPVITLPRLRALGHQRTNLRVVCLDLPVTAGIQGVLGSDFFRRFHIFINYQKGFLVVREAKGLASRLFFWLEVLFAL